MGPHERREPRHGRSETEAYRRVHRTAPRHAGPARDARQALRPRLQGRVPRQGAGRGAPRAGRRAPERVPGAAGGAGHPRRRRRAPGAGRRRQGRHHPPRHERREPAGRLRALLQGALVPGARPRLPLALRQQPASPRRDRHLQPLLLRGGPRGARAPRDPPEPAAPPPGARPGRLEEALPRHQRLGAVPHRPGLHRRQAAPEPLEGGAAHPLPPAHRPARPQLEVLGRRRQGARLLGRLPEGLLGDALQHRAPSGRPGT